MDTADFIPNHFLIAMPRLADPNFFHTVTYLCEHNADGALGIVVNRPLNITLRQVLEHMDMEPTSTAIGDIPIYMGGPVQQERGFVLHRPLGDWEATLKVSDDIGITSSRDIIEAISRDKGPQEALIALGYAGWGSGQLEQEMAQNAWLNGPADTSIVFDLPAEERWEAAAAKLGVDLNLLSGDMGHA